MVSVLFVLDELFLPEVLVLVTATLSIELGFNDVIGLFYFNSVCDKSEIFKKYLWKERICDL